MASCCTLVEVEIVSLAYRDPGYLTSPHPQLPNLLQLLSIFASLGSSLCPLPFAYYPGVSLLLAKFSFMPSCFPRTVQKMKLFFQVLQGFLSEHGSLVLKK